MEEISVREFCNSSDVAKNTVEKEIVTFLSEYVNQFEFDPTFQHFKMIGKDIWLTGDNLITRKQMYRRMGFKCETINDDLFSSYIVMPYVAGRGPRFDVNKMRNAVGRYSDNPFCFFSTLKEMYINDFSVDENDDAVKRAIANTKGYWELFGEEETGYNKYLKEFCLQSITELEKDIRFQDFFVVKSYTKEDVELYEELLKTFRKRRLSDVKQRISVENRYK